jgi:hypothetical protein
MKNGLAEAIKKFRDSIDDKDYANLGAKGKYLTVPYRIKFVRDFFGERMSIQTDSTELANGSHKFKANIYIDDKLVSVGESKQMKNADKEFEKQQTVSIGRGLSILGFFGDELATAEEMEQFLKPQKKEITKPIIKPTAKPKANTKQLADEWIEVLKKTATHSVSVGKFEQNLNPLRQEYLSDLKQINSDLIQQQRIDQEYISLQKQITTNRTK